MFTVVPRHIYDQLNETKHRDYMRLVEVIHANIRYDGYGLWGEKRNEVETLRPRSTFNKRFGGTKVRR